MLTVFLKTYLTLPSVFHHNRDSLQTLRWLLGPQEGNVLKGTLKGGTRGRKGPGTPLALLFLPVPGGDGSRTAAPVQDGDESSLWKGDLREQGGVTQGRMLSPPPCAGFNTANNSSDIWLATAAQGIFFPHQVPRSFP